MRIAICDDEELYSKNTKEMCINYLQEQKLIGDIIEFSSGEQLLAYREEIHILLLDIEMKEMDGIAIKEQLEGKKQDTMIIFLTSHTELMQEAFGRQVYSFLIKPIQKEPFYKAMNRVIRELEEDFTVELDNKERYIRGKNILYIESEDKYTKVMTQDSEYLVRRSMNEWENILEKHDFYRIHKSYIVNLAYVKRIDEVVIMDNGTKVNLSRRNSKEFKEIYYNYVKRKAK